MDRRTRIWIGVSTAVLVGSSGAPDAVPGPFTPPAPSTGSPLAGTVPWPERVFPAQAEGGEGGPNEGGGPVIGTITEFRLSSTDPDAFAYDASDQVSRYTALVHDSYAKAHAAAEALNAAVGAFVEAPSGDTLETARAAWLDARAAYLGTEAFLFYAGPVDGPGGPLPRLNTWPVDPTVIDGIIADTAQSLNFRALARENRTETPVRITTGLHVIEYLLWGDGGARSADDFASGNPDAGRRGDYLASVSRLLANDLGVLVTAWAPGTNNYRHSVEAMDQRNALGRAFNGMTVLLGYELPLRRIGAGLFPANENYQPSPFSDTSAEDNRHSFESAREVYFGAGLDALVAQVDPALADAVSAGFSRADAALAALDAPYDRFLAPATGSEERRIAEAAIRALTDLGTTLRHAGNRLGVLVIVPGL